MGITKKSVGNLAAQGVYPVTVEYSALCESGFSSSGSVATDATMAVGWKPSSVDTAYPLCDPTHHYLLTIRKVGTTVTVWAQDVEVGSYTSTATSCAELLAEALTEYAGVAKGYFSRLVIIEAALDYETFYRQSPSVPGLWVPNRLGGLTIHTLLDFSNAADLGADSSGNGNDWTLTSANQSTDTPTNNICTINPLTVAAGVYSNGLRSWQVPGNNRGCQAVFGITSGKWYFEVSRGNGVSDMIGVTDVESTTNYAGYYDGYAYYSDAGSHLLFHNGASLGTYGSVYLAGDVVGVIVDMDIGAIWFTVNGVPQNGATYNEIEAGNTTNAAATWTPDGRTYYPGCGNGSGAVETMYFADAELSYDPPSGFATLSSASAVDDYKLSGSYTGNGNVNGPFVATGCTLASVTIDGATYDNDGTDSGVIVFLSCGFKMVSTTSNAGGITYNWTGTLLYPFDTANAQVN